MSTLSWLLSAMLVGPVWSLSLVTYGPRWTGAAAAAGGVVVLLWGAVAYVRQRRTDDDCGYATTVFGAEPIATVTELFPRRPVWPNEAGAVE